MWISSLMVGIREDEVDSNPVARLERKKKGGRKKATPNHTSVATRERIENEADPIGFLCRVGWGDAIDGAVPTLDQYMGASKILAGKIVPDLRSVEMEDSAAQLKDMNFSDVELEQIAKGSDGKGSLTALPLVLSQRA